MLKLHVWAGIAKIASFYAWQLHWEYSFSIIQSCLLFPFLNWPGWINAAHWSEETQELSLLTKVCVHIWASWIFASKKTLKLPDLIQDFVRYFRIKLRSYHYIGRIYQDGKYSLTVSLFISFFGAIKMGHPKTTKKIPNW